MAKRFARGKCYYCGVGFNRQPKGRRQPIDSAETVDHVYPNGLDMPAGLTREDPRNKVRCCARCNNDKGHMHPVLWLTLCPTDDGAARLAGLLIELGESRSKVDAATVKRKTLYGYENLSQSRKEDRREGGAQSGQDQSGEVAPD